MVPRSDRWETTVRSLRGKLSGLKHMPLIRRGFTRPPGTCLCTRETGFLTGAGRAGRDDSAVPVSGVGCVRAGPGEVVLRPGAADRGVGHAS